VGRPKAAADLGLALKPPLFDLAADFSGLVDTVALFFIYGF
jgi:hypothetical protein